MFFDTSLLKCLLARCRLDAVSTSRVFEFAGNVGADSVKFGAENVLFGMLVAPNLAPWGPSSDAGGLGSTRKETLGVQAWISVDFGRFSGPPFGRFWPTLVQQLCFLACVFTGHVF